ncbi:hypothetical protein [Streptomyces sp. L2]|nr:hypothetical protein [Streptomyces sp. L2]
MSERVIPSWVDMNGARMIAPDGVGDSTGEVQQTGGHRANGLTFNYSSP